MRYEEVHRIYNSGAAWITSSPAIKPTLGPPVSVGRAIRDHCFINRLHREQRVAFSSVLNESKETDPTCGIQSLKKGGAGMAKPPTTSL